eukprot:TRINITY_DN53192_c0_g1_i1.p1 TRINITY_DN53192_c0_g1~~TRINITY_DN53192_c0_g1_i1.p1  ORF type:complete len:198 (+),score=66.40 TRINITY_DN53192_c0_g1_i1:65-658(+)
MRRVPGSHRLTYQDSLVVSDSNESSCCCCCSRGGRGACCESCCDGVVCGVPKGVFIATIAFLVVLYGSHIAISAVNLDKWSDDHCGDSTKEYVFLSSILLTASLLGGCFVGAHVGDRNRFVTVLALVVDFVILCMITWGTISFFTRSDGCEEELEEKEPDLLLFWRVTFFLWIFHLFFIIAMINCWGRCKRNTIVGI